MSRKSMEKRRADLDKQIAEAEGVDVQGQEPTPETVKAEPEAAPKPPTDPQPEANAAVTQAPPEAAPSATEEPAQEPATQTISREDFDRVEKDNRALRRQRDQANTVNQALAAQVRILTAGVQAPPQEQPPFEAPTSPPAPTPEPVKFEMSPDAKSRQDAVLKEIRDVYGDQVANAQEELMNLQAEEFQRQISSRVDPLLEGIQQKEISDERIRQNAEREVVDQRLKEAYPNYKEMVLSPEFAQWLESSPVTQGYKRALFPPEGQLGAGIDEMIGIFNLFKQESPQASPSVQAAAETALAADGREAAAAAESVGTRVPVTVPGEGSQPNALLRSEMLRRMEEVKNKPTELFELEKEINEAVAAGLYIDDLSSAGHLRR